MAYKHKITGDIGKQIAEKVKGLPTMAKFDRNGKPMYRPSVMDGLDINMTGERDKNGNKFIEGAKYKIPVLQYVNHLEMAREIFVRDGMAGVDAYIEEVKLKKAAMEKEHTDWNRQQVWHRKLINRFRKLFKM